MRPRARCGGNAEGTVDLTSDRWRRIESLCYAALARPAGERAAFLTEACGDDAELRAEVESLLAGAESSPSFLETQVGDAALPSLVGRQLGAYRIDAPIGAGGMGEVYRAKDTRLGRDVAVKILPAAFAADAQRRSRFEREARAIAALNHPNICTIHDVGHDQGIAFLVMELVDGESLAARLAKGPVPLDEALARAIEMADALDKAHGQGIIHRDLKPGNVMLARTGSGKSRATQAKLLDFGLARIMPSGLAAAAAIPADPVAKTETGAMLGTPQYMAPEQIEGQPADARTDIFAFGALLHEMLTGRRAFAGTSTAALMAAILREDPPPVHPREVGRIVRRCLAKDPLRRYQSARDLLNDLEEVARAPTTVERPERLHSRERLVWSAVSFALIAALAILAWKLLVPDPGATLRLIAVDRLTQLPGGETEPAIAPDGKSVVYVRDRDLWFVRVGGRNPINLTADSPGNDFAPVFSPDGELVAFNSNREGLGIWVMGSTGENIRRVTTRGFRPAWTPDGTELVFAAANFDDVGYGGGGAEGLEAVNIATGRIRSLCACIANGPAVSPRGTWVAYWGMEARGGSQRDLWLVPLAGLDAGESPIRLTDDAAHDWNPQWSPDGRTLYFVSDRGGSPNLWRLPIDQVTGRARGGLEAVTLPASFVRNFRMAADGRTVVFTSQSGGTELVRVPFNPQTGASTEPTDAVLRFGDFVRGFSAGSFSPDDHWVAVQAGPAGNDILLLKLDGSVVRTLVPADAHRQRYPAWSPDGRTIALATDRSGKYEIWGLAPDGSNLRPLLVSDRPLLNPIWSPDGSLLAAAEMVGGEEWGTIVHRMSDPPDRFERLPTLPTGGTFSADAWTRRGTALAGSGSRGGIWEWSIDERTYRQLVDTGPGRESQGTLGELPGGRFLLYTELFPGMRIEQFDPASGARAPVLTDEGGVAALARDGTHLWLNRWKQESDLWIARLEEPRR